MTTQELPRETFKSAADSEAENEIAQIIARWTKTTYLPIGFDPPDKQKSRIDGAFARDGHIVAFAEIKTRTCRFREYPDFRVSATKVTEGRALYEIVRVPVLLIVRFGCGTIGYLDVSQTPYQTVPNFGRYDRNSPGDIEEGAAYQWEDFKLVQVHFIA
jgi:hypothetical protein